MKTYMHKTGVTIILFAVTFSAFSSNTVNAIIGDESFIKSFGYAPDENTNEQLRLRTHLAYVEMLLRAKDVNHLSSELQQQRLKLLDLLHQYWTAGVFPKNYDYPGERQPCFIDRNGNICAVGYLVEQTAGRKAAERINRKYQYEEIMNMHDEQLDEWIENSGLTPEECAKIQPAYDGWGESSDIGNGYAIGSALWNGLNISLAVINGIQITNNNKSIALPVAGIFSGAAQVMVGVANYGEGSLLLKMAYLL